MVVWYVFPHFGILYQEKSGNTACRETGSIQMLLQVTH
jgi:hypothetical protein